MSVHETAAEHRNSENPGRVSSVHLARMLDAEIRRYQKVYADPRTFAPWFPRQLEDKFNADTSEARARDLGFTISLGCLFYFLSTLTDFAFAPDIGLQGFAVRLATLPLFAVMLVFGPKLRPTCRELMVAALSIVAVATLAAIPFLSRAPQAAFAFTTAMLGLVYTNTTLGLRFRKACVVTTLTCALIVTMAVLYSDETSAVGWAISLQTVVAGAFSIIANYRIERSARLGYLLDEREALRLKALTADREKLKTLSSTDALTDLANRGSFNRWCAAAFAKPENVGVSAALLMINVDHFKQYNDYYGHLAGDDCLRSVAQKISSTVRGNNDIVARYGGEEFVVFLLDISPGDAEALAERICAAVRELKIPHANRIDDVGQVTISVGVATMPIETGGSLVELIESADRALYLAKRKGRNRCEASLSRAA